MRDKLLPKEVYCWSGTGKLYTGVGPLKCAIRGKCCGGRAWGHVYVAVITDRLASWPDGWVDVTEEFIMSDGSLAW